MPAFSLFAILGVDGLRLRLRNRCGLGLNRNPPFLDGLYPYTDMIANSVHHEREIFRSPGKNLP